MRFLDVVNPTVRFGATLYPTVRFGAVFPISSNLRCGAVRFSRRQESYGAVRFGAVNRTEPHQTDRKNRTVRNPGYFYRLKSSHLPWYFEVFKKPNTRSRTSSHHADSMYAAYSSSTAVVPVTKQEEETGKLVQVGFLIIYWVCYTQASV